MREMFTWPWCFSHNAPMIPAHKRWVCYFEEKPTRNGSEGCQAITAEFQWTGEPFDLAAKPVTREDN